MAGSPINDIFQMRQQGLSNNQIIQNLQRAGYTNTQIFDAMNQADTKMAVEGVQPGFLQPPINQGAQFSNPETVSDDVFTPSPVDSGVQEPSPVELAPQETGSVGVKNIFQEEQVKVEELVEAVIEEKWVELMKDVSKIVDWKNKIESRISDIEIKLAHLKDSFSDLNRAVIGKVNEYDKHIVEIGSDIRAMEKVFSKVLPALTENVSELSRIADKIKGKEGFGGIK